MKLKRLIFPFSKNNSFLEEKWWHRFFKVAYVIAIACFLFITFEIYSESIGEYPYNVTIKNNLRDFTKNSDKSIGNTIPLFLGQGGSIACFENNKINSKSTYTLESESICSADISSHIDEAVAKIPVEGNLTFETRKKLLTGILASDTEKRYCFTSKSLNCTSDKIILYSRNEIYYL